MGAGPRGPVPKPAATRQRRNKVSTAATLRDDGGVRRAPTLKPRQREWNPMTLAWWVDIWHSPMAAEFLKSDIHGLYLLADLLDRYWQDGDLKLAAEFNRQRAAFGLTPIDRRRLQWEVERAESAGRRKPPLRLQVGEDPRERLRAVK